MSPDTGRMMAASGVPCGGYAAPGGRKDGGSPPQPLSWPRQGSRRSRPREGCSVFPYTEGKGRLHRHESQMYAPWRLHAHGAMPEKGRDLLRVTREGVHITGERRASASDEQWRRIDDLPRKSGKMMLKGCIPETLAVWRTMVRGPDIRRYAHVAGWVESGVRIVCGKSDDPLVSP